METKKHLQKKILWDTRNTEEEGTVGTLAHMLPQGFEGGLKKRNYITKIGRISTITFFKGCI